MGLVIGVIMGVFGIGLMIIPIIIDIYLSRKQTNDTYKKELEASAGIIIIAIIFMIAGLGLVAFSSGWDVSKSGYSGFTGGGKEGENNQLLNYMLLRREGLGSELGSEEGVSAERAIEAAEEFA